MGYFRCFRSIFGTLRYLYEPFCALCDHVFVFSPQACLGVIMSVELTPCSLFFTSSFEIPCSGRVGSCPTIISEFILSVVEGIFDILSPLFSCPFWFFCMILGPFCALVDLVSDSLFSVNSSCKTPNQVKPTRRITDYCLMVIVQRKVPLWVKKRNV